MSPAAQNDKLPAGRLLAYYGDDFTGSTDVMEAFTFAGLPTVLFLERPDEARLAQFRDYRAVGLAGTSRSRSAAWMRRELPPVFAWLKSLGAPITQYKVCSTFDSSPEVGSIGIAMEAAQEAFGSPYVPLVVGAPALRRYQVFGNLFAAGNGALHRLDRHPTMRRHPVTPMDEADLRLHLARQTQRRIGLVDLLTLQGPDPAAALRELLATEQPEAVFFDVLDEASLREVGRLIWEERPAGQLVSVSSSGLQYALLAHWHAAGLLEPPPPIAGPGEAEQMVVVSGSCAQATEAQIRWALAQGYAGRQLDARDLVARERAAEEAVRWALAKLKEGRNPILYTALGLDDTAVVDAAGEDRHVFNERLGHQLGRILRDILRQAGVRRAVVCGGDTSGRCAEQLGLYALTAWTPIAPGSPLCRGCSGDEATDGLAIALKGGQVGSPQYFEQVRQGAA